MTVVRYCTPEWLEFTAEAYRSTPKFQQALASLTVTVCFLVKAEPSWGIDKDIVFGTSLRQGELERVGFFSEEDAKAQADYILAATPQEWKKILRKQNKFVTDFMLGKITLPLGSKVGMIALAPHSGTLVDVLTQAELKFPDEMTPEELAAYRAHLAAFRQELGV